MAPIPSEHRPTADAPVPTPAAAAGPPIGAAPFAVTVPPELVLGSDRTGSTSCTVSNLMGRPGRVRLIPHARQGAEDSWLRIDGPTEVPIGVAGTVTATLVVTVPPTAPAGEAVVALDVVAEDDPEQVTPGQAVRIVIPPPPPQRRRVPWLVIGIVAAIVVLLAGGAAFFLLRGGSGPVNTAAPTISGEAVAGRVLTADPGTWSGDDPGLALQWLRCDGGGGECVAVPGATGRTLTLGGDDLGHRLQVQVTATDADGEAVATSQPAGPVQTVVPPLTLPLREARRAAAAAGLTLSPVRGRFGCLIVTGQDPEPGRVVPAGTVVTVTVAVIGRAPC